MRVALVLAAPSGSPEGDAVATGHALALTRGLIAAGDLVQVLAPPSAQDIFAAAGATVTALEVPPGTGPRDVPAVTALRRALRGGAQPGGDPVDVVHGLGLRSGFVAGLARPAGLPLVVTWLDGLAEHGVRFATDRALARIVAGAADVTLCSSPGLVEAAERLGARGVALVPVVAAPLPAPARPRAEVRTELSVPDGAPVVLTVGRLDTDHRHEVLVAAAARWRSLRPVPTVVIAGTGPAYRHLAGQVVVGRAPVQLLGRREDVADLLGAADVAVVTGVAQDGPVFAQAALAAGVALVAPATAVLADLVGESGSLVALGDVDALDVAVRTLLEDPVRRAAQGEAGARRAAGWPDEQTVVDAVRNAYTIARTGASVPGASADDAPHELR